ncbi:MAG: hypothetical protein IJL56_06215 [Bacteroidales bacterium]|nr:hypothetical protein [Bacteroidales bacterium]
MKKYAVREILSRKEIKTFIRFPEELYRDCPQYVPALRGDQMHSLTKAAPLAYCKRKLWLAFDGDGKVVGRICGMINPRYNELYGTKRARFGWFDMIDDFEVARLLLETAEEWARSEGMTEIHGPLYYNTLGKQGMLVEGFGNVPVFNTLYNFPYYNDFVQRLGYAKECDWVENKMVANMDTPEKVHRIAGMLMEKYRLHEGSIDRLKKDPERVRNFFRVYSDSFSQTVHNFIPFTEEEIEEEASSVMRFLSDKVSCIVLDENEELVAFGIAFPDISRALQKCRGRLFPFGWIHLLRALKDFRTVDLMINGAVPEWQNRGISAVYHSILARKYMETGTEWALSNPQIETNGAAVNVWNKYGHELYMRRRCYIKAL